MRDVLKTLVVLTVSAAMLYGAIGCEESKQTRRRPAPAPAPDKDTFGKVSGFRYRIVRTIDLVKHIGMQQDGNFVEKYDDGHRIAWQCRVTNESQRPRKYNVRLSWRDKDNFELMRVYSQTETVQPGQTILVSERITMDGSMLAQVTSQVVTAKAR